VLLIAAVVVAAYFGWQAAERRYLLRLVSRREGVDVARQALEDTVMRLAEGSDEQLMHFADDPDSLERRTLHEVASRAHILADELDTMQLPKKLVPAADALADAAYVIAREAGKIQDDCVGDDAFEALASIDLAGVAERYSAGIHEVEAVCEACGLEDAAVYGGGLYL
jgi:hypothetical protein